jgi:pyrimidine-nucleoside phosphorylase
MHLPQLIERKRDGGRLSSGEIKQLIAGFTSGHIPDYQMSAMAMAILWRGMDAEETCDLTQAMLESGERLHWPAEAAPRVDKHSTGGIGDKTSLILAPLLACEGLWVPMISGRGLGITGGTLDKLESIPNFRTELPPRQIETQVRQLGCAMVGQSAEICPADRRLYALRDVTGTVPSLALITASILSKKLAEGLDRLVLDVKYGEAAFMPDLNSAEALAQRLQQTAEALGLQSSLRLNPMDEPCGKSAGNALEVIEACECLMGSGPNDLRDLVLDLAEALCPGRREALQAHLQQGRAWEKFGQMVQAQGGNPNDLPRLGEIHRAPTRLEVPAPRSGRLSRLSARAVGEAILELGGGRQQASDCIDPRVGCDQLAKVGQSLQQGEILCRIHAASPAAAESAAKRILQGVELH